MSYIISRQQTILTEFKWNDIQVKSYQDIRLFKTTEVLNKTHQKYGLIDVLWHFWKGGQQSLHENAYISKGGKSKFRVDEKDPEVVLHEEGTQQRYTDHPSTTNSSFSNFTKFKHPQPFASSNHAADSSNKKGLPISYPSDYFLKNKHNPSSFTLTSKTSRIASTKMHPISLTPSATCLLIVAHSKYNLFYLLLSLTGLLTTFVPFQLHGLRLICYAMTLLDICVRGRTLRNILSAVQQNANALTQTFILILVAVFIYATIGFSSFQANYRLMGEHTGCRTMFECLVTHYNQGLREAGIANHMDIVAWFDQPWLSIGRLIFDVSYWMVITVMLLNVVSGIIIDTFGQLRDVRSAIDKDMETRCFICGIDSMKFQRYGRGFDAHVRYEHNMWQYLFFQEYLLKKEKSEFTGQESYIWKMLQQGNTTFYPLGKAMILENETLRK